MLLLKDVIFMIASRRKLHFMLKLCCIVVAIYLLTNLVLFGGESDYAEQCLGLYKQLRYPNKSLIFRPPLRRPPANMLKDFQQNGDMPITGEYYFDEAYADSGLETSLSTVQVPLIKREDMEIYEQMVRSGESLGYGDLTLAAKTAEYERYIRGKSVVVVGTISPWIEAIASVVGARKVTTLDYTRKHHQNLKFEWIHVYDFLDHHWRTRELENYDAAMSFSSIEHAGLGRYGDALDPNGDINAVRQVHCMLKPGGLFILGLPSSKDGSSYIEFNAHRVYGTKRLELLFRGWKLIEQVRSNNEENVIYFLIKK